MLMERMRAGCVRRAGYHSTECWGPAASCSVLYSPSNVSEKEKLKQNEGTKENPSLLSTKLDGEMFLENHDNKSFKEKINVVLLRNKFLNEKSIRIEENTKYYNLELEKHNGSIAEMRCCIKNYLDPAIFKTVIEDKEPGIIRRCFPWIETAVEKMDGKGWIRWLMRKVKEISKIYIDLFKDLFLVFTIILTIGGFQSLLDFPRKLTCCGFLSFVFHSHPSSALQLVAC